MIEAIQSIRAPHISMDTVRASGLSGIEDFIYQNGGNAKQILRRFQIDPASLNVPDAQIRLSAKARLLEYCALEFENPLFGLEFSKYLSIDVLGPIAMVVRTSATIGEALKAMGKHFSLMSPVISTRVDIDGPVAALNLTLNLSGWRKKRQINEHCIGVAYNVVCSMTGSDFKPKCVNLTSHVPPILSKPLEQHFDCVVRGNQRANSIEFASEILQLPIDTRDSELNRLVEAHLNERIADSSVPIDEAVRKLVRELLPLGRCQLTDIATYLGKHPRGVQKELESIGTEFREILKEQRMELARNYLLNSRKSISEIAEMLGYSDQATFTRAFSRLNDISPLRFRKSQAVVAESVAQAEDVNKMVA